jgi:hypothetical protein
MDFEQRPLMLSSWDRKQFDGATRRACARCGVHALVVGHAAVTCTCCGAAEWRPVHGEGDPPAAPIVVPIAVA